MCVMTYLRRSPCGSVDLNGTAFRVDIRYGLVAPLWKRGFNFFLKKGDPFFIFFYIL